jgi:hypothetical protein
LQEGDRLHVGTEIGGDESDVADAPQACGEERGHEVEVGDAEHQESEGDVGDHDQGEEEDCRFGHCPEGVEVATTEPHADDQAAEDLGEEVQLWGVCHLEGVTTKKMTTPNIEPIRAAAGALIRSSRRAPRIAARCKSINRSKFIGNPLFW